MRTECFWRTKSLTEFAALSIVLFGERNVHRMFWRTKRSHRFCCSFNLDSSASNLRLLYLEISKEVQWGEVRRRVRRFWTTKVFTCSSNYACIYELLHRVKLISWLGPHIHLECPSSYTNQKCICFGMPKLTPSLSEEIMNSGVSWWRCWWWWEGGWWRRIHFFIS